MRTPKRGDTSLTVGPTENLKGGSIKFGTYVSGEIRMEIEEDTGSVYVVTLALMGLFGEYAGERCVWLKTYGLYEGLPEALVRAGLITLTGRTFSLPHGDAAHAALTELAYAHYTRAINNVH
jgi:hypothetical protein